MFKLKATVLLPKYEVISWLAWIYDFSYNTVEFPLLKIFCGFFDACLQKIFMKGAYNSST